MTSEHDDRIYLNRQTAAAVCQTYRGWEPVEVPSGWIIAQTFKTIDAARARANELAARYNDIYAIMPTEDRYFLLLGKFCQELLHRPYQAVAVYIAYPSEQRETPLPLKKSPAINWEQVGAPFWSYGDGSISAKVYQNQQFWLLRQADWGWMVLTSVTETVLRAKSPEQEDVNMTTYRQFTGSADTADEAKRQAEECIVKHRKENS